MATHDGKKVLVVGAGIGGLATALALQNAGIDVEIYDDAADNMPNFGIMLASNGVAALRLLGVELVPGERGETLQTYEFRTPRGRAIRQMPMPEIHARLGTTGYLTSRADLREVLLAKASGIPLIRRSAVTGFEIGKTSGRVSIAFEGGRRVYGDAVIGTDGVHSVIRRQLVGTEPLGDSGYICWLGIVPFEHHRLTSGLVSGYLGAGQRFGISDIGGGRAFWWATKAMPAELSRNWSGGKAEVMRAYEGWADEAQQAIRATPEESIVAFPMVDRPFLEQWGKGPVTLLGDAAHPMLVNAGQGAAMVLEDAVVLGQSLATATHLVDGLRDYEDRRRDRTRQMVKRARLMSDLDQAERPMLRVARALSTHLPAPVLVKTMTALMTPSGPRKG